MSSVFRLFPGYVTTGTRTRAEQPGSARPARTICVGLDGFLQSSPNHHSSAIHWTSAPAGWEKPEKRTNMVLCRVQKCQFQIIPRRGSWRNSDWNLRSASGPSHRGFWRREGETTSVVKARGAFWLHPMPSQCLNCSGHEGETVFLYHPWGEI